MKNESILDKFEESLEDFIPSLSVDCVILGYQNSALHALVLRWKDTNNWSLPGGFVKKAEDLDHSAFRVLKDRTGLDISFLKQLHVFGNKNRRDIPALSTQLKEMNASPKIIQWFQQRFISVTYLALVNPESFIPIPDYLSEACEWLPIKDIPQLYFDHNEMIAKAKEYTATQIKYQPIGLMLLPEKFTMKMLQKLYEVILDKPLDRGNFQKKILKLDILTRHEKQMSGAAHKAPFLYSFNTPKYYEFLERGIGLLS